MDLGNIEGGEDFERRIKAAVEGCHVLLVMISPQWLLRMKEKSRWFRAKDERNWVIFEIETALKSGVHILPVFVHGAQMPSAHELPTSLNALSLIHGMEVGDLNWEADVYKVIKRIEELFDEPRKARQRQTKEREVPPAVPRQPAAPTVPVERVLFDSVAGLFRAAVFIAVVIIVVVLWNYPQKAKGIFESVQGIFVSPKPQPSPFRMSDVFPRPTPTLTPFRMSDVFPRRPTPMPSPVPTKGNPSLTPK